MHLQRLRITSGEIEFIAVLFDLRSPHVSSRAHAFVRFSDNDDAVCGVCLPGSTAGRRWIWWVYLIKLVADDACFVSAVTGHHDTLWPGLCLMVREAET